MIKPDSRRPDSSPQALQEGEELLSEHIDDAVHWYRVYTELVTAAEASNLPEKAAQFRNHAEYWRRRWKMLRDRQA
jgi:hypothetical protein